jgi:hypothetical protein
MSNERMEQALHIGAKVLSAVDLLKKDGRLNPWHCPVEDYTDPEFDIILCVSLEKKKTQKEIGEAMFCQDSHSGVEK